jgi:hypothetical protein
MAVSDSDGPAPSPGRGEGRGAKGGKKRGKRSRSAGRTPHSTAPKMDRELVAVNEKVRHREAYRQLEKDKRVRQRMASQDEVRRQAREELDKRVRERNKARLRAQEVQTLRKLRIDSSMLIGVLPHHEEDEEDEEEEEAESKSPTEAPEASEAKPAVARPEAKGRPRTSPVKKRQESTEGATRLRATRRSEAGAEAVPVPEAPATLPRRGVLPLGQTSLNLNSVFVHVGLGRDEAAPPRRGLQENRRRAGEREQGREREGEGAEFKVESAAESEEMKGPEPVPKPARSYGGPSRFDQLLLVDAPVSKPPEEMLRRREQGRDYVKQQRRKWAQEERAREREKQEQQEKIKRSLENLEQHRQREKQEEARGRGQRVRRPRPEWVGLIPEPTSDDAGTSTTSKRSRREDVPNDKENIHALPADSDAGSGSGSGSRGRARRAAGRREGTAVQSPWDVQAPETLSSVSTHPSSSALEAEAGVSIEAVEEPQRSGGEGPMGPEPEPSPSLPVEELQPYDDEIIPFATASVSSQDEGVVAAALPARPRRLSAQNVERVRALDMELDELKARIGRLAHDVLNLTRPQPAALRAEEEEAAVDMVVQSTVDAVISSLVEGPEVHDGETEMKTQAPVMLPTILQGLEPGSLSQTPGEDADSEASLPSMPLGREAREGLARGLFIMDTTSAAASGEASPGMSLPSPLTPAEGGHVEAPAPQPPAQGRKDELPLSGPPTCDLDSARSGSLPPYPAGWLAEEMPVRRGVPLVDGKGVESSDGESAATYEPRARAAPSPPESPQWDTAGNDVKWAAVRQQRAVMEREVKAFDQVKARERDAAIEESFLRRWEHSQAQAGARGGGAAVEEEVDVESSDDSLSVVNQFAKEILQQKMAEDRRKRAAQAQAEALQASTAPRIEVPEPPSPQELDRQALSGSPYPHPPIPVEEAQEPRPRPPGGLDSFLPSYLRPKLEEEEEAEEAGVEGPLEAPPEEDETQAFSDSIESESESSKASARGGGEVASEGEAKIEGAAAPVLEPLKLSPAMLHGQLLRELELRDNLHDSELQLEQMARAQAMSRDQQRLAQLMQMMQEEETANRAAEEMAIHQHAYQQAIQVVVEDMKQVRCQPLLALKNWGRRWLMLL